MSLIEKENTKAQPQSSKYVLRVRNQKLTLGPEPWIAGILNVTPDSFSDGGRYLDPEIAVERALVMVEHGARIIDIGGESTRPGSKGVPLEEELARVIPVVKKLRPKTKALLSVDTRKSQVARAALDEGADGGFLGSGRRVAVGRRHTVGHGGSSFDGYGGSGES